MFGHLHAVLVIAAFLEPYPDVDVRLLLGDRNANLLEEHVDVALRIGELPDSGLVAAPGAAGLPQCAAHSMIIFRHRGSPKATS